MCFVSVAYFFRSGHMLLPVLPSMVSSCAVCSTYFLLAMRSKPHGTSFLSASTSTRYCVTEELTSSYLRCNYCIGWMRWPAQARVLCFWKSTVALVMDPSFHWIHAHWSRCLDSFIGFHPRDDNVLIMMIPFFLYNVLTIYRTFPCAIGARAYFRNRCCGTRYWADTQVIETSYTILNFRCFVSCLGIYHILTQVRLIVWHRRDSVAMEMYMSINFVFALLTVKIVHFFRLNREN